MGAGGWALALVAGLVALAPAVAQDALGEQTDCAGLVAQDDAGSGRDAGDVPLASVPVSLENHTYRATLGVPRDGGGLDVEDWYAADWGGDVVRVRFAVREDPYFTPYALPVFRLEVWAPGDEPGIDEPAAVADPGGTPAVWFSTDEAGTWRFRVALAGASGDGGCAPATLAASPRDTYLMYLGCDPHCELT